MAFREFARRGTPRFTIASTLGINILNMGLGLATGILTARGLGPHDRGVLLALTVWLGTISSFSLLGLDDGIVYRASGGVGRAVGLYRRLLKNAIRQALVGVTILSAIVGYIVMARGDGLWIAGVLLVMIVPLNNVCLLAMGALRAAQRFGEWNAVRVLPQLVYASSLLALVVGGVLSVTSGVACLVLANMLTTLRAVVLVNRLDRDSSEASDQDVFEVRKFGRRLFAAVVPAHLNLRLDQMILGVALAPSFLGVYAVAVSIAGVLHAVGAAAEQVLFPRLAGGSVGRERLLRLAAIVALAVGAAALMIAIIAGPLIELLFGSEYLGATRPLQVLVVGAVMVTVGNVFVADAKSRNDTGLIFRAHLAGVVVTLVALPVAAMHLGLVGAALASLLSYAASATLLMAGYVRHSDPIVGRRT